MWHNNTTVNRAKDLAKEIAAILGYEVVIKSFPPATRIELISGTKRLILHQDARESKRMTIMGGFPDGYNRYVVGYKQPSIGVSLSRSAASIARDIQRRLLGTYEQLLGEVMAVMDEKTKNAQTMREIGHDLASRISGSDVHEWGENSVDIRTPHGDVISIRPSGSARVTITTDNIEFLRDLADLINKHFS